jgi:hypothetical protein
MPKLLKDILNGVKKSKIVPGSTGTNPGVDYEPKAPNEQEFVKKHEREEHADRVGNGDDIYQATNIKPVLAKEPRHGRMNIKASEKVNEAVDTSKKTLKEVLTKNTSAKEIIDDFENSDDPKFAGKSKEERRRMALGAYYSMHPEKSKKTNKETLDEQLVHVDDGSKYGSEPHPKDMKHVMDGMRKFNGTFHSHTDKGGLFNFDNKTDANHFVSHVRACPHKSMNAVLTEETLDEDLAVPLLGGTDGDESAEMAKTQLRALANKALHLAMQLGDEQVVEPWVQAKIAVAKDHVTAVHDYMIYGDHSKDKEEDEQAPYDGGIDMSRTSGIPDTALPNFSVDVSTGRNV